MITLYIILLLLGFICFIAAAFGGERVARFASLVPLGLAFWILVPLIQYLRSK